MKSGSELIADERQRQIIVEGWSLDHDDEHDTGELALAAACYASPILLYRKHSYAKGLSFDDPWPWPSEYGDKRPHNGNVLLPSDPTHVNREERISLLVKAGALIVAEIERLQRLQTQQSAPDGTKQEAINSGETK